MARRTLRLLIPMVTAALALGFAVGSIHGGRKANRLPQFHDMRVNHVAEFVRLVDPEDPEVKAAAARLGSLENAYLYVRDFVLFDPTRPVGSPGDILREGRSSCLGKAILLCSLYRALGMPARDVRVVSGEVATPNALVEHAWLELEYHGTCFQQDATSLLGTFDFDQFPGTSYSEAFIRKEHYCFNDHGFAVISQLNLMRSSRPPGATAP